MPSRSGASPKVEISRVCLYLNYRNSEDVRPTSHLHFHFTMAEKEATVYVVDLGRSMGARRHDRPVTDLDWAMQYVWDKITATVRLEPIFYEHELTMTGGNRPQDSKCGRGWTQDRW